MPQTVPAATPTPELLYLLSADPTELAEVVAPLRGGDIAEALNRMDAAGAARVLANLPFDLAVEVLDEPELDRRHEIVEHMERGVAGALVGSMAPDRRADLLRELPAKKRRAVLSRIDEPERNQLEEILAYPEHTAGAIMTTEFVHVPPTATVADALAAVGAATHTHDQVYGVHVVDAERGALLRTIAVPDLVAADRDANVLDVGDRRPPLSTLPLADQELVARMISKYNLLSLPVVDATGRMLGIVTVDDVIDAMVREATEDVQKFGGQEALGRPYLSVSLFEMVKKRAGWLAALFLSEMLTASAMQHFSDELARAVVLTLFIPLVMSSGGNSGSQATSLIIRALALGEVKLSDWWRVVVRELPAGLLLGLILGIIGFTRIFIWQHVGFFNYGPHYLMVALTVAIALVGIVTFGSLAGSMLPFVLRRLGFDPASASAPFVATLVDVTGLSIYFTVALLVLRGTLL
jgi:magnesium transporter